MRRFLALLLFTAGSRLAAAELPPIAPGSFAVATTNLEAQPRDSGAMFDFLNGKTSAEGTKYLTDILVHPDAVPTLQVEVPADRKRFGDRAGTRLPLVLLIVYPTTADNPRPNYTFPYTETGDRLFTHMQQLGDKPLLADPGRKYPLIVITGGYNTHGLWHLFHLKELAAHGYVVVDMFHGDGREAALEVNVALRSLELHATLDFMLAHPDFGPAIDPARIGVTGESIGGHTAAAALGGIDPTGAIPPGADPRVKAGFGVVPFLGGEFGFWPFKIKAWYFGEDHAGLRDVHRPFLAVYGGKDTNVPPEGVEAGVAEMKGPTFAVRLNGETHALSEAAQADVRSWEVRFFDAWLKDDAAARRELELGTSTRGGTDDRKTVQRLADKP